MAILKPQINGKSPKNAKRQRSENQTNTKTERLSKWGSGCYIYLASGAKSPISLPPVIPLQQTLQIFIKQK